MYQCGILIDYLTYEDPIIFIRVLMIKFKV